MAEEGAIEQPFFIYDHSVLQKEEDDIKDAIIYFYPPMTSVDDRCALCGQLMGMVTFFISLAGAPPSIYRLQKSKVAVHHQGRFTLALGGDQRLPDKALINQLDFILKLFTFFHRDLADVAKLCERQGRSFVDYLGIIWDTYIPFIRYYGDDFLSAMRPVPTVQLSRGQSSLFLRATNLLETCQRAPAVLAGCLLVRNKVLCTQLTPGFTSRLLLLRPHQTHLPCRAINTDFSLPVGVRLLAVYITEEEETLLYPPWCELETEEVECPSQSTGDSCTSPGTSHINPNIASDEVKESEEDTLSFVSLDGKTPRSSPDFVHSEQVQPSGRDPVMSKAENGPPTLGVLPSVSGNEESIGSQPGNELSSHPPDKELCQTVGCEVKDPTSCTSTERADSSQGRSRTEFDMEDIVKYAERITQSVLEAACAVVYGSTGGISQISNVQEYVQIKNNPGGDANENNSPLDLQATSEELCEENEVNRIKSGPTTLEELAAQLVKTVLAAAKTKISNSYKCNGNEKGPGIGVVETHEESPGGCRIQPKEGNTQGSFCIETVAKELAQLVMKDATGLKESTKCVDQEDGINPNVSGTKLSSVQVLAEEMTQSVVDSAVAHVNGTDILAGELTQTVVDSALKTVSCTEENPSERDKKPTEQNDIVSSGEVVSLDRLAGKMTELIVEDVMNRFSPGSNDIKVDVPKSITNPDKFTQARTNLTLDINATRTSLQPSSPLSSSRETLPLTPLTPATKTELFKAVKQASKIAVQSYEALTSGETSPEPAVYQGPIRRSSRAGSDASSRESDSPKVKTLSVDSTMKRLVSLTKPAAEQAAVKQTTHSKKSTSSPDQRSLTSSDTSTSTEKKETPDCAQEKKPKRIRKQIKGVSNGLREVDLYIQGNNDLLLLLVMEGGTSQEKDTVHKLWKLALPQLGDMDLYIKERRIGGSKQIRKDVEYNYLLYNSSQQTLKGNKMQPVTGSEHQFCQTTVAMHDDFCNSDTLTDIMLRSHSSFAYGHRSAGQEMFFQIHGSARNMAGFPNEREVQMAADAVAYQKMLTEEHALII